MGGSAAAFRLSGSVNVPRVIRFPNARFGGEIGRGEGCPEASPSAVTFTPTRAVQLWTALIGDAPDSDLAREGKKKVAELEPLIKKK